MATRGSSFTIHLGTGGPAAPPFTENRQCFDTPFALLAILFQLVAALPILLQIHRRPDTLTSISIAYALAGFAGKMADPILAVETYIQTAVAQHVPQQTDGTEPIPRLTSPALSTASDQPGPDQVQTEGDDSYETDTDIRTSQSAGNLCSTEDSSSASSLHPLSHACLAQKSCFKTLPRFQFPLELISVICGFLVSEDNCNFVSMAEDMVSEDSENKDNMCEIIIAGGNKDIVHTVGHNLRAEDLKPDTLAFLQKYCESIRGITVDTTVLHDGESLLKLLDCVKGSLLKVISFHPFAKVNSDEVHDVLNRFYKQHSDAQVIIIPGKVDRVRGCEFSVGDPASFFSIIGVEYNKNTYTNVVTRLNGDLATTKRLVTRNNGQIKQMTIFCGQHSNNTNWQEQMKNICEEEPMKLENLYLYDSNPHDLGSHINLAKLEGIALLLATFSHERRQSEEQFYKELVIQKVISDNTDLEELIHIVNGPAVNNLPEISEETLTNVTNNLTRIRKFCWHQGKRYSIPIGQIISRWKSSLKSFSYRDGGDDLPYEDIHDLFEENDSIESFACDHKIVGLTLQTGKYDEQMKVDIQADGQEISKAISPRRLQKNMKTLLFFVAAVNASVSQCSEGSPEFSRRIDITKSVVADLVEALADGGVYTKMLHIVPRGITWACSPHPERHPPGRALSFRVWTRPEEPSNFVTDAMKEFSKQRFIVTLAEHLSPDEERELFYLGGIGDHTPIQIEQALIQQHIPRREPAEVYHDRLFGQGQFWKSVRRNIFPSTTEVASKRSSPIPNQNQNKRVKVVKSVERDSPGGKRGGKRADGKTGKRAI